MTRKLFDMIRLMSTVIAFLVSIASIIFYFIINNNSVFSTIIAISISSILWLIVNLIEIIFRSWIKNKDDKYIAKDDIVLSQIILFSMAALMIAMVVFVKTIIKDGFSSNIIIMLSPITIHGIILNNIYSLRSDK